MTVKDPEILSNASEGPEKARLKLRLPADLLYFKGHFPSAPILPGVVQIDWAIRFAQSQFKIQGEFKGMEALKFQQVLQPGEEPELELEFKPAKNSVFFRYVSARGRHSSGSILFGMP
jgi:3-hydroxymyristoyl/3-hydroxydecanoyl-(acyl carrier protein) dehydratase